MGRDCRSGVALRLASVRRQGDLAGARNRAWAEVVVVVVGCRRPSPTLQVPQPQKGLLRQLLQQQGTGQVSQRVAAKARAPAASSTRPL